MKSETFYVRSVQRGKYLKVVVSVVGAKHVRNNHPHDVAKIWNHLFVSMPSRTILEFAKEAKLMVKIRKDPKIRNALRQAERDITEGRGVPYQSL